MKVIIYTSPFSARHNTGENHPENAARLEILQELFDDYPQASARPATLDQIMLAHDQDYIYGLQDKTPDHGLAYLDGDTILSPDSYDAALYAAGAVCQAVDMVVLDERPPACGHGALNKPARQPKKSYGAFKKAFCAVRPPGHHAEPGHAMGFCLFNNIFIGARHSQEAHGLKRIAIVDFDVHHGNGTETMSRAHNKNHPHQPILYISSHGYPLFPMSGDPAENDNTTLNIRLPDGCTSAAFRRLYETRVFPALRTFKPDLIMLSAGFDAHQDDPLANIALKAEDYGWLTDELCQIADKIAKSRVISVLEGGYELTALKECVRRHLQALNNN